MRAFVHASGMSVSDPELWRKYKALTDEERARYEKIGQQATNVHRLGLSAFGPKSRATTLASKAHQMVYGCSVVG